MEICNICHKISKTSVTFCKCKHVFCGDCIVSIIKNEINNNNNNVLIEIQCPFSIYKKKQ